MGLKAFTHILTSKSNFNKIQVPRKVFIELFPETKHCLNGPFDVGTKSKLALLLVLLVDGFTTAFSAVVAFFASRPFAILKKKSDLKNILLLIASGIFIV